MWVLSRNWLRRQFRLTASQPMRDMPPSDGAPLQN